MAARGQLLAAKTIVVLAALVIGAVEAKNVHYIHWNRNNPMFRIDNTDHIVDVNKGNLPWEYDQVNLICPVSKPGTRYPEKHVIYSVSKEEYESCRITNPKPRIVAICNRPHRLMYFTITFRSFTPTPGGLEFHPGQDYYFISTSSRDDLHRRVGGGCSTHNMKMIFKVHTRPLESDLSSEPIMMDLLETTSTTTTTTSTPSPAIFRHRSQLNSRISGNKGDGDFIYYYHPRDVVALENALNEIERSHPVAGDRRRVKNSPLRFTSSSSKSTTSGKGLLPLNLAIVLLWRCLS